MSNKQAYLGIIDHFQNLVNKIDEIYFSDRFEPDDFGGYLRGLWGS